MISNARGPIAFRFSCLLPTADCLPPTVLAMRQLKIAVLLVVAIALQSALRAVWQPLGYVDLALILVVYFALQREPLPALVVAAAAGLTTDLDGATPALVGAGGFAQMLTTFADSFLASRGMADKALLLLT